jgi:hypothetical protein
VGEALQLIDGVFVCKRGHFDVKKPLKIYILAVLLRVRNGSIALTDSGASSRRSTTPDSLSYCLTVIFYFLAQSLKAPDRTVIGAITR